MSTGLSGAEMHVYSTGCDAPIGPALRCFLLNIHHHRYLRVLNNTTK
jgi:hypothetical protein